MKLKGIVKNNKKGWIIRYLTPVTTDGQGTHLDDLPIHPDDIKKIEKYNGVLENEVVDFKIFEPSKHALYFEMITYAKII